MEFTDKPLRPFGEVLLDMAIPGDLSLKTALVFRMVKELADSACFPPGDNTAELVFDEALTNAIVHGNRLDAEKSVRVRLFADEERWGAIVEDEGDGFEPTQVPQVLGVESLLRESGRGIMIMDSYLDELIYSAEGNKAMLVRRRQAEPEPGTEPAEDTSAPDAAQDGAAQPGGPVSVKRQGNVSIAEVVDDNVSGSNSETIRAALAGAAEGCQALVVDMHRVRYMSSVGIAVLVAAYKAVRDQGGVTILVGVQSAINSVLETAKLTGFFQFAADQDEAVKLAEDMF